MAEIRPVAIVGAGLIGSGWALVFARAGFAVRIYDPSPDVRARFMPWARQSADELARAGLLEDVPAVIARLSVRETLEDTLSGAFFIQESVFETVEAKTAVSLDIDASMDADAVVGSSSSGIPASKFTGHCKNRSRFLVVHPVNPPHLVPVVEIVPAPWTAGDVVDQARDIIARVGQVPVCLSREIDGFVLNRLQGVLLNEAWALYEDGIASLDDIDATIAHGLGLRWSFMGPFETIDLNAPGGIADYAARLRGLYAGMVRVPPRGPWPDDTIARAAGERRRGLAAGELAARRAWRDGILARLAAFKRTNGLHG